jgi:hypothetical protein
MEFLDAQERNSPEEDSGDAQSQDDTSVNEDADAQSDSPESQSEKQNTLSPGIKKRIDSLTAKYKAEQNARREAATENAKLREAVRLYSAELERVSQFAKLDPQAEKIRELELQREIDQIETKIPRDIEEQFTKAAQEAEIEDQAAEIADQIRGATSAWDGLFTARELALFMRQNHLPDAQAAANYLGEARLQAAQRRQGVTPSRPQAPQTAAARGTNAARETAAPWKYKGANSILDFFDSQDSQRGKRR